MNIAKFLQNMSKTFARAKKNPRKLFGQLNPVKYSICCWFFYWMYCVCRTMPEIQRRKQTWAGTTLNKVQNSVYNRRRKGEWRLRRLQVSDIKPAFKDGVLPTMHTNTDSLLPGLSIFLRDKRRRNLLSLPR